MKKIISGALLLGSLLVVTSACGSGKAKLANTQELPIKGIEQININYHSEDVNFYESDSKELKIEEYLLSTKEKAKADIQVDGKTISIKGGKRDEISFGVNNNNRIDIYLPKEYQEILDIGITSGALHISQDLKLKEFVGSANSGSMKLSGVTADIIALSTTSGAINAKQVKAESATLKNNSGDVKVDDLISRQLVGECSSGSLKFERFKGNANLTANSGSIKLGEVVGSAKLKATSGAITASFKKVNDDIEAVANSGSIKLVIPKNLSFKFDGEVSSGSVQTDFDQSLSKEGKIKQGTVGSDPEVTIDTKVTSGSIKVLQEN